MTALAAESGLVASKVSEILAEYRKTWLGVSSCCILAVACTMPPRTLAKSLGPMSVGAH